MKIIVAPQSFKGSLSAKEATLIISQSVSEIFPDSDIVQIPIADGGDGTLETIIDATDGEIRTATVNGPLNDKINASWGLFDSADSKKTAIIEMARSSGLALLDPENLNPYIATTYGTGELILEAINNGCKKIILGIGGSATNDCGVGLANALGIKFIDNQGNEIIHDVKNFTNINMIDLSGINPKLISGCPKVDLVDAIRISQDSASSSPPPSENPSIIAIVGLVKFHTASHALSSKNGLISVDFFSTNSEISAPAFLAPKQACPVIMSAPENFPVK